jgi:hypothetical protein
MRPIVALVLLAVAKSLAGADSNVGCIERLDIPGYPPLAASAGVSLTISATVLLSPDGTIQETKLIAIGPNEKSKSLFVSAVQTALNQSTFQKACAGKLIDLTYDFALDDNPKFKELVSRISFTYPNKFWIVTRRPHYQP